MAFCKRLWPPPVFAFNLQIVKWFQWQFWLFKWFDCNFLSVPLPFHAVSHSRAHTPPTHFSLFSLSLWTTCQLIWHFPISWALSYCADICKGVGENSSQYSEILLYREMEKFLIVSSVWECTSISGYCYHVHWCQLDLPEIHAVSF